MQLKNIKLKLITDTVLKLLKPIEVNCKHL